MYVVKMEWQITIMAKNDMEFCDEKYQSHEIILNMHYSMFKKIPKVSIILYCRTFGNMLQ